MSGHLQPLTREELRQLRRDDRLRDRSGHEWTVRATAYLDAEQGEYRVVLVAGAQVLIERERFHDGYMLVADSASLPTRRGIRSSGAGARAT